MIKYKQDIKKLNNILSNIENFINEISQGDISNLKNNSMKSFISNNNEIDKNKTKEFISPSKNYKIKISNNYSLEAEKQELDISIYKRKVNKLIIKINEMENKYKIEKLKYLFCIGDYHKKLTNLEKKLNMDSIDKMPKSELKKLLCYPHYVKFDIHEEINPKCVRKTHCKSSIHDNRIKDKIMLNKSEKGLISIDYDLSNNKDNNNSSIIFEINKDKNNENVILSDIDDGKKKEINFEQIKNMIELGRIKFDSKIQVLDKLFGTDKNFFISHPKLNYIKSLNDGNKMATWKLENQINSLPKELSKLKILSKSQKNAIVVFPSFLNETMANLEKLRTSKNFRSIENKFEETLKKTKKLI